MTRTTPLAALLFLALPALGSFVMPIEVSVDVSSPRERAREARVADREEALYDRATEALDDHDWQRAARIFRQVADQHLEHSDAALYWLAYSKNKQGLRGDALTALAELKRVYPKSRWIEDGKALEVEIRQSSGQRIEFSFLTDEDSKIVALSGLMDSDPDQAVRIGEQILESAQQPKVKDRVLFVFSQSGDPRAISIVSKAAKDTKSPDIQKRAVRYLAAVPGDATKKALAEVYTKSKDVVVRRAVMKAFLISGDRNQLLILAKTEPNIELRGDAVNELGALRAHNELDELYRIETAVPVRKRIIQAFFISGNPERLIDIAKTEKNPELRATAVRNLGFAGSSAPSLMSMYDNESDTGVRRAIIESLSFMGGVKELGELAQKEKDPGLKNEIEQKLERLRE